MGNHMNTLEQIKRETRDDARLYACIRDQGFEIGKGDTLFVEIPDTCIQSGIIFGLAFDLF